MSTAKAHPGELCTCRQGRTLQAAGSPPPPHPRRSVSDRPRMRRALQVAGCFRSHRPRSCLAVGGEPSRPPGHRDRMPEKARSADPSAAPCDRLKRRIRHETTPGNARERRDSPPASEVYTMSIVSSPAGSSSRSTGALTGLRPVKHLTRPV